MDKYFMWIHYQRLHNHTTQSTTKPCAYFLGYTLAFSFENRPQLCMFYCIINIAQRFASNTTHGILIYLPLIWCWQLSFKRGYSYRGNVCIIAAIDLTRINFWCMHTYHAIFQAKHKCWIFTTFACLHDIICCTSNLIFYCMTSCGMISSTMICRAVLYTSTLSTYHNS